VLNPIGAGTLRSVRPLLGARSRGIGFDPAIIYIGAHAQVGPIVKNVWFRPSYEFGFGDVTKINSLNLDGVYYMPLRPAVCRQYSVRWQIQAVNADDGTDAYAINPGL
jgi:hypothetical protein